MSVQTASARKSHETVRYYQRIGLLELPKKPCGGTRYHSSEDLNRQIGGLEAIDVQQFHVWSDEWVNQGDWLETVQKLKQQGKIKYFGGMSNGTAK
jgi:aryl-alcohol dehydrogenase-like predicted oxidoreductase